MGYHHSSCLLFAGLLAFAQPVAADEKHYDSGEKTLSLALGNFDFIFATWKARGDTAARSAGGGRARDPGNRTCVGGDFACNLALKASIGGAEATYLATGRIAPSPAGGIDAAIALKGSAKATFKGDAAASRGTTSMELRGVTQRGNKVVTHQLGGISIGGECESVDGIIMPPCKPVDIIKNGRFARVKDPIFIKYDDIKGITIQESLFEYELMMSAGLGFMAFDGGELSVFSDSLSPISGSLMFWYNADYVVDPGLLSISFVDGIITESTQTGRFAGLLPGIGERISGSFALPVGRFEWDFPFAYDQMALSYGASVDGQARVGIVPEPGIWLSMISGFGLIGLRLRRLARQGLPLV